MGTSPAITRQHWYDCRHILYQTINATNVYTAAHGTLLAKFSLASNKAEIAFVFLFGFLISTGCTPLQSLYPVEVLRCESRAKGMDLYNFWVNIASFYNTFVIGIAFTDAGWRYYFLYIFWDIFEFVFIYFFFVETKNRTLEELTEIFTAKKPVEFSLRKKTEIGIISDEKGHVVLKQIENSHSNV
ncbi:uncharacterized protein BHQ10_003717 [Talaromyces amestolkiae]|uniref:Major facilitator superfamily (MFS) profile domain-containing protein n=1 Tax=Talaromyces amestolkiae TaxID=1196081 RepID=A0A364KVW6_TALAM|nr:uncharacterized protein BHQ10_003717 [Talaromyces amestolkiae]RAO67705.1 hypothetical protein BHQ10_003717 [Talaromyces amestolkiae]